MWIVVLIATCIAERVLVRSVEQKTNDKNLANLAGAGLCIFVGSIICAAVLFDLQVGQEYVSYYINDYIEINEILGADLCDGHIIEFSNHGNSCLLLFLFGAGLIANSIFRIVVVFYKKGDQASIRENATANVVKEQVNNINVGHMDEVKIVENRQYKQSQEQEKQNAPYWCGKCGFLGPYKDRCPSCNSSIKIFNVRH